MKHTSKIVSVAVLLRLPFSRSGIFSYLSDRDLSEGTLVDIPFGRRRTRGVVVSPADQKKFPKFRLKKIHEVVQENALSPQQIQLAQLISREYITPIGVVLEMFLTLMPPPNKKRAKKKTPWKAERITLTTEQGGCVASITTKGECGRHYLFAPPASGKTEVHIAIAQKIAKEKGQTLFLVPELPILAQSEARFSQRINPEKITVVHGGLSPGELARRREDIRTGAASVILATRIGLFADFHRLRAVIVDEEHSSAHKEWHRAPRYDARRVALWLSQMHDASILFSSSTPSVEYYYHIQKKFFSLHTLKKFHAGAEASIEVVDMRRESLFAGEKRRRRTPVISNALRDAIGVALAHKRPFFLFAGAGGFGIVSICAVCRKVFRCPECEAALSYHASGVYHCRRCSWKSDIFFKCPRCGSMAARHIGSGTQRVEREVARLFPLAKILRADRAAAKTAKDSEKIFREVSDGAVDILIATQMAAGGWNLPNLGGVGIIEAERLWGLPDFSSDEHALQLLLQSAGRVGRNNAATGAVIVQTREPEKPLLVFLKDRDWSGFCKKELSARRRFSYPPFSRAVRIVGSGKNEKKLESAAARMEKKLQSESITVLSSGAPVRAKIRAVHLRHIILSLPPTDPDGKLPEKYANTFRALPSGWYADTDPISLV